MTCEPCTYSQAPEVGSLPTSSWDMSPSPLLTSTPTPAKSCEIEKPTDGLTLLKSSKAISERPISQDGPHAWIASQRDSLARIFQAQAGVTVSTDTEADFTAKSSGQLTMFDQDSCSLRIVRKFGPEGVSVSLPTLWRVDTPGATEFLPRLMSGLPIRETDGGFLLPTLTVCGNYNRKGSSPKSGDGIATALRKLMPTLLASSGRKGGPNAIHGSGSLTLPASIARLPTLCATDWKSPYSAEGYAKQMQMRSKPLRDTLVHSTGHRLTSAFAEWWMGWPIGWTGLNAPETVKSRLRPQRHGSHSEGR